MVHAQHIGEMCLPEGRTHEAEFSISGVEALDPISTLVTLTLQSLIEIDGSLLKTESLPLESCVVVSLFHHLSLRMNVIWMRLLSD